MKKYGAAFILAALLLFSVSANALTEQETVEQTIQNYFDATQSEDVNAYKNVMLIEGEWEDTRVIIEKMWELFDTKDVKLSNFETSVSGEKAVSVFDVQGVIIDAETKEEYPIDTTYIAILRKQEGKWLLELSAPIDDFTAGVKDVLEIATINTEQTHAQLEEELQSGNYSGTPTATIKIPGGGNGGGDGFDDFDFDANILWIVLGVIILAVIGALYLIKKIFFNKFVLIIIAIAVLFLLFGGFALLGGTGDADDNGNGGSGLGDFDVFGYVPTIDPHSMNGFEETPAVTANAQATKSGGVTSKEATQAYQEYIAAYNRLTDLMSQGKGDTPEAQQAYKEYKEAKEKYEQIAKSLK